MTTTYGDDETVEQAYERVKRKPHWEWDDFDRDDVASYHMALGMRAGAEERKKREGNVIRLPPRSTAPKKSLREHLEEVFAEEAERLRLTQFEERLGEIVRGINCHWARSIAADLLIAIGD